MLRTRIKKKDITTNQDTMREQSYRFFARRNSLVSSATNFSEIRVASTKNSMTFVTVRDISILPKLLEEEKSWENTETLLTIQNLLITA